MKDRMSSLGQHEAFLKVNSRVLNSIAQNGEFVTYQKKEELCQEGKRADFLFFLLSGRILLSKENRIVSSLKESYGHFGWNKFDSNYDFTATAESDTTIVFKIHRETLCDLFLKYKTLTAQLYNYTIPMGAFLFIKIFNLENIIMDQKDLLTSFKYEFFHPEQTVLKKGTAAQKFYIISSGSAMITTNNKPDESNEVINYLKQGDYFGEIALLEDRPRMANVIAAEELSVFTLSRDAFNLILSNAKWKHVRKYMTERIKKYAIEIENTIIGSDDDCDLQIFSDNISPKQARLTKTTRKDGTIHYSIKPLDVSSQYKLFHNRQLITKETALKKNDELFIGNHRLTIDTKLHTISVHEIDHYSVLVEKLVYKVKGSTVVDQISFSAESNELVCVMGPSGSGKSTLIDLISGAKKQTSGDILYNLNSLYENLEFYRCVFGYVPQDDILFSELTVFENLYFAVKLREPFITKVKLEERIDHVLGVLKLLDKKHQRVGNVEKKGLSGGERKRVNIARGLVFNPYILFLDEPTSGLSSKDSDEIVDLLRELADMGKLVFVVLHQPAPRIFRMFDKIVFLDKGGKLVFTGQVLDCIQHMKEVNNDMSPVECPECGICQPELIFDILEERNDEGDRKYSPEFWKKRFKAKMVYDLEKGGEDEEDEEEGLETPVRMKQVSQKLNFSENISQICLLLHRTFFIKIKNWSNMLVSMGVPVVIALLLGLILYYSPEKNGEYSFYQNKLIPVYLFIGVILFIFLGLTNSVKDIVSEQSTFNLENKVRLRIRWYVLSKFIVLALIAAVQISIFLLIGNLILGFHGAFKILFIYLYFAVLLGVSFGLFLSSAFRTSEAVVNWIPLILIPQIILGGAIIRFEEMGKYLYFSRDQLVPEVCQIIPSRWIHEALVVAQANLNPRDRAVKESIIDVKNIKDKIYELKRNGIKDREEIKRLKKEIKRLQKEKGIIDSKYPSDIYRNRVLEESARDGSGIYAHYKDIYAEKDTKRGSFYLTTYDAKSTGGKTIWFNSPFCAEYKGLLFGDKYYEMKTVIFNPLILSVMIILSLLLCMLVLRIKKIIHLRV